MIMIKPLEVTWLFQVCHAKHHPRKEKPCPIREVYEKWKEWMLSNKESKLFDMHNDMWKAIKQHCEENDHEQR